MISIVIPAYNEEQRIVKTVERISEYFKNKKHEIIVVSDGSKDNTKKVVEDLKIKEVRVIEYHPNKGKGGAMKTGMLEAKGDHILTTDADLSTPIEQIEKFYPYMTHVDVVIGSRAMRGSVIPKRQPFYREFIGKTFNKIVVVIALLPVHDTQCGFKLFSKKAAHTIFSQTTINGWAYDVEALFIAKKSGFQIKEIPIVWINDEGSKINPIKDSIKMFFEVLKIRLNALSGKYK